VVSIQAANWSAGTARTSKNMPGKPSPLKWLDRPWNVPGASACRFNCVVMPFIV
jgi:hypothetical protein